MPIVYVYIVCTILSLHVVRYWFSVLTDAISVITRDRYREETDKRLLTMWLSQLFHLPTDISILLHLPYYRFKFPYLLKFYDLKIGTFVIIKHEEAYFPLLQWKLNWDLNHKTVCLC